MLVDSPLLHARYLQSMMLVPNELDTNELAIFFLARFLAIVAALFLPERRVLVLW